MTFHKIACKGCCCIDFSPPWECLSLSHSVLFTIYRAWDSLGKKIIIMVFGCSLLLFSQSLTEYSDPMKQDRIYSLQQAPSFRVRNCMVWGRGWEGTLCSGGKNNLSVTSPAHSELRRPNPLVRKKIILPDTSPNEVH